MSTAIFIGTFDPLHGGHIGQLLRAHHFTPFNRVLFLVDKHPAHKPKASGWQHRLKMAELTLSSFDLPFAYEIGAVEDSRAAEITEAVDYKVTGIDSLAENLSDPSRWELATRWPLIVLSIPGIEEATLRKAVEAAPAQLRQALHYRYVSENTVPMMNYDFEKQTFRAQRVHATYLRSGASKAFIPPEVQDYIREYGLYAEANC